MPLYCSQYHIECILSIWFTDWNQTLFYSFRTVRTPLPVVSIPTLLVTDEPRMAVSQFSTVYNAQGPLTTESPEAPSWHSNGLSAMVGTGCVLTGLLLLVNWGDPGWWRHGIVCSLPHSSPFSKKHPTQRDQQFQNFPAHFLPPPTKIASDHTKLAYSPVREPLYK